MYLNRMVMRVKKREPFRRKKKSCKYVGGKVFVERGVQIERHTKKESDGRDTLTVSSVWVFILIMTVKTKHTNKKRIMR